jgi:hypothetical protein
MKITNKIDAIDVKIKTRPYGNVGETLTPFWDIKTKINEAIITAAESTIHNHPQILNPQLSRSAPLKYPM